MNPLVGRVTPCVPGFGIQANGAHGVTRPTLTGRFRGSKREIPFGRILTPTLSSFGEERANYFAGRFPGVAAARQRRANFLYAFSVFEFCIRLMARTVHKDFPDDRFAGFFPGPGFTLGFALVKIQLMGETSPMPITLDQIVEETREMPGEVVAELVDRIMVARHGGIEPSVAESWKAETDRRIAEIESGKVKGVTPEENAARIQKILRR
jgi:putative addiction module component (TIGR02574 family)